MMTPTIEALLSRTAAFDTALREHLAGAGTDGSKRSLLTVTTCALSMEHGQSLRMLVAYEQLTSASALLRIQLETTIRAVWCHYAANDEWLAKMLTLDAAGEVKENAGAVPVNDMLRHIGNKAPADVARMLLDFKTGVWTQLNAYVHSGVRSIVELMAGRDEKYSTSIIMNSNGLTLMAAMLTAMLTGNPKISRGMRQIQLDHVDCLPPLDAPPPADSSGTTQHRP